MAAPAGAEPGPLRKLGGLEEPDAIAPRPAAGAARPAEHTGAGDGIYERAVHRLIATHDGGPPIRRGIRRKRRGHRARRKIRWHRIHLNGDGMMPYRALPRPSHRF